MNLEIETSVSKYSILLLAVGAGSMIDYLEQLVEEKKFREALNLAEQLLKTVESPNDLVRIHAASVVSHCMLGEREAALAYGDSAMELARELKDWDSYGTLTVWLGITYGILGQLTEAIHRIYQYVAHLPYYRKASTLEFVAWYNLGVFHATAGQSKEAVDALTKSLAVAIRHGELRFAHGVRQALIKRHLEDRDLQSIPRLLVQGAKFLRSHPEAESHKSSWAYHTKFRGEYLLATGRVRRAELIATRALLFAEGDSLSEFLVHMLLANVALTNREFVKAVGHALAARSSAVALRRADMETEANELVYATLKSASVNLQDVDQYYLIC